MLVFVPRKLKYKKFQKLKSILKGVELKRIYPYLGCYGLKVLDSFKITFKHVEMLRILINRKLKNFISKPRIKINVHPVLAISRKSSGLRMGKGKGNIKYWVFPARSGRILFELGPNIPFVVARSVLLVAKKKLSSNLKFFYYRMPVLLQREQRSFFIKKLK